MDSAAPQTSRSSWRYALAGVCAVLVLFCSAQALSVFFASTSSPLVALGSTIIYFTPAWLKDWAIGLFGTNDKLFLFVVLSVVAAVLAGLVGLLARRNMRAAVTLVGVLAFILGVSVLSRSNASLVDVVPTLMGTVLGLGVLVWLTDVARRTAASSSLSTEPNPTETEPARRNFLLGAGGSAALSLIAVGVAQSFRGAQNVVESARSALGSPPAKVKAPALPSGPI